MIPHYMLLSTRVSGPDDCRDQGDIGTGIRAGLHAKNARKVVPSTCSKRIKQVLTTSQNMCQASAINTQQRLRLSAKNLQ